MEAANNKKEIIVLRLYSILILIYSVFDIITGILPRFLAITIKPNTAFVNYFFTLTGIALYSTPINIIVGYGLLRRRFWARYGAIAVMLTFPIIILTQFLWWGAYSLNNYPIVVQCLFVILTLLYFSRGPVKALFGQASSFRFMSWHGLLVIMIILISFSWIIFSLYWKVHAAWKCGHPFFIDSPQLTTLEKSKNSEILGKYRKVELISISLLVPKEFSLTGLKREGTKMNKWVASLRDIGPDKKGYIGLHGNAYTFDFDELKDLRKKIGPCTKFDFEKFILTNNWNPIVSTLRAIATPSEKGSVKEIHINDLKGFLIEWQKKDYLNVEFSLYDRDDKQTMRVSINIKKGYFDKDDTLAILSSVEFLRPEEPSLAQNHYEKGLALFHQGNVQQARVEFANAYYLSPENPTYIFMFAKSLPVKETKNYKHIKDLLDIVLRIKPNHKEAQKLLKEVESKLPKGAKSN